jgi:hypothetical protein
VTQLWSRCTYYRHAARADKHSVSVCSRHHGRYGVAYYELRDTDHEFCEHGLTERRRSTAGVARELLISPNGIAHFPGCPHKGDHPDDSRWASLDTLPAWERLGNGEQLQATGGRRPGLLARTTVDAYIV